MKFLHSYSKPIATQGAAGFTLVELMVVVAIIGILAAVAGPRVQAFRARGVQSEAKANLNSIYLAQSAYQDANDKFFDSTSTKAIDCSTSEGKDCGTNFAFRQLPGSKYNYGVIGDSGRWAAIAVSKQAILNNNTDIWRINASKVLCAPNDAVLKKANDTCSKEAKVADLALVEGDAAQ